MKRLWSLACVVAGIGIVVAFTGCGGGGVDFPGVGGDSPGGNLVGTWQADRATVGGEPTSVPQALDLDSSVDRVVCVFWPDGTSTTYGCQGGAPVDSYGSVWTASGDAATVSASGRMAGYECTVAGDQLTMTQQSGGNTVTVAWTRAEHWAGGGGQDARLHGMWQAVSATANGESVPIAQAYGYDSSVDRIIVWMKTDGTLTHFGYAGCSIRQTDNAVWSASGGVLRFFRAGSVAVFDYATENYELTATQQSGGDTIVIVWVRVE